MDYSKVSIIYDTNLKSLSQKQIQIGSQYQTETH